MLPSLPIASGVSQNTAGNPVNPASRQHLPSIPNTADRHALLQGKASVACKQHDLEVRVHRACGCTLDAIHAMDVQKSAELRNELARLQLNEYFDDRGTPRFRRLGLTFVAKQQTELQGMCSSHREDSASQRGAGREQSAKAFFLATEARERDLECSKRRTSELLRTIDEAQRFRVEDVRRRQLEVLFGEVPDFERHLPSGVLATDLQPLDPGKDEEQRHRRAAERSGEHFADRSWSKGSSMRWMLRRSEVLVLSQIAGLWMRATRGPACQPGMDRATFCRFILDLGLVDQHKVPFFWAVSLFDELALPMRCHHSDVPALQHCSPLVPVVSWWLLTSVLDAILRQHFDDSSKQEFFASLFRIAKLRLPEHVIQESGLDEEAIAGVLADGAALAGAWSRNPSRVSTIEAEGGDGPARSGAGGRDGPRPPAGPGEPPAPPRRLRQELMQERLVRSLMVEPEVLHAVMQHSGLFRKLHSCYADERGDMQFPMLLQFCLDFHLTPPLVSSHFLKGAYESARSLDVLDAKLAPPAKEGGPAARPSGRHPQDQRGPSRPARVVKRSSKPPQMVQALPGGGGGGGRDADAASAAPAPAPAGAELPWQNVAKLAERRPVGLEESAARRLPAVFGVGAFVETLCRAAFTYLGSYGNAQQQGMSGHMRVTWLCAYLHCVYTHLRQALERHKSMSSNALHAPLLRVLQYEPSELWAMPSLPTLRLLGPTTVRAGILGKQSTARRGQREAAALPVLTTIQEVCARDVGLPACLPAERDRAPLQSSHCTNGAPASGLHAGAGPTMSAPAGPSGAGTPLGALPGTPCVVHGICKLCQRRTGPCSWGNARCRGCSVVDVLRFQDHPLKPLLLDWPPDTQPQVLVAQWPLKVERAGLTPPPLGSSDKLRSACTAR